VTIISIARSKRDGTRVETRFGLPAKRTSPFKSAGVSVQSTAGSRGVRISGQQLYRPCSVIQWKTAGYPLHSHLSPSLPLTCVTVCHQIPNALILEECINMLSLFVTLSSSTRILLHHLHVTTVMKSGVALPVLGTKGRNAKKKLKLWFYSINHSVSPSSDNKTRQYGTRTRHEAASGNDS